MQKHKKNLVAHLMKLFNFLCTFTVEHEVNSIKITQSS